MSKLNTSVLVVTSMFDHGGVISYWKDVIAHHTASTWVFFCNKVEGVSTDPFKHSRVRAIPGLIWNSVIQSSRNLWTLVDQEKPDVVFLNATLAIVRVLPALVFMRLFRRSMTIKCVFHNRAIYPVWYKNFVNQVVISICTRLCNERIFVSEAVAAYWWVSGQILARPFIATSRQDISRTKDKIRLGFLGRLSPEKDPELFLQATCQVTEKDQRVEVDLGGEGILKQDLEQKFSHAKFSGWVNPAEWLQNIDLLIVSSHTEGWPFAVGEALELGVPVIGMNVGGVGEILRGVKTKWLVQDRNPDVLAQLILDFLAEYKENYAKYFQNMSNRQHSTNAGQWAEALVG